MGRNATVVVLEDALSAIEEDGEFGKKVAHAIRNLRGTAVIDATNRRGGRMKAAVVVESHDSTHLVRVLVGNDTGVVE